MKKWIGLMALTTAAATTAGTAFGTALYEPFNYDPGLTTISGTTAPNGFPWAQVTANDMPNSINPGSLPDPTGGLPTPQGGSLNWAQGYGTPVTYNGAGDRLDIGGYASGSLYFSMLFTAPDTDGYNSYTGNYGGSATTNFTNGSLIAGISNSVSNGSIGVAPLKLYMWRDPLNPSGDGQYNDWQIGATGGAAGNLLTNWSADLETGQTYLIVGEISDLTPHSPSTTLKIWINPASSTFGSATDPAHGPLDPIDTTGTGAAGAGFTGYTGASFFFRETDFDPSTYYLADELRIGTTYADVTPVRWTGAGDGASWGSGSNWSGGTSPSAQGANVTFDAASSGSHNIALSADTTVGTINLNGDSNYTISGTNQLILDTATNGALNVGTDAGGGGSASGDKDFYYISAAANPARIIVSPTSGNVTETISAPVYLNRSTRLTVPAGSTLNFTGGVMANPDTAAGVFLTLDGGGTAVIKPASTTAFIDNSATTTGLTGLEVNGTLRFTPAHAPIYLQVQARDETTNADNTYLNTATAFFLSAGSTLDLGNNDMIIDYEPHIGETTGNDTGITGRAVLNAVANAYDHGAWDQAGITSTDLSRGIALAAVDNENLATPLTSVDGIAIDPTSAIVKYTWYGDANLDGYVNDADVQLMGDAAAGWAGGDFNYDGVVNNDDLALLMLGEAVSGGASITPAPEPGAALLAALCLGGVAIRRRRSR